MIRRANIHLFAMLLALSVALVAGGALTHELDHVLHKHDVPCALHLYAGHADGIASAGVAPVAISMLFTYIGPALSRPITIRPTYRYAVRAPPYSF